MGCYFLYWWCISEDRDAQEYYEGWQMIDEHFGGKWEIVKKNFLIRMGLRVSYQTKNIIQTPRISKDYGLQ